MSDQTAFFSRLGSFFRGPRNAEVGATEAAARLEIPPQQQDEITNEFAPDADVDAAISDDGLRAANETLPATTVEARSTFLRPWAKRDAAIQSLQDGFGALTGLMTSVKDSLDRQNQRQDELVRVLSALPEVLQTSRVQSETLQTMTDQLRQTNEHHSKLGTILDRMGAAGEQQGRALDELRGGVERLNEHDAKIAEALGGLGAAVETASRNSQASTEVLGQIRDGGATRDGELQQFIRKQSRRYTAMLSFAIALSAAAVCAVGYLFINAGH